jgi:hypothetical protein
MVISVVAQGTIKAEGKVFELDSPSGLAWLDSAVSFRFEPMEPNKPYTARRETSKKGNYWYGYRKVAGQLHKKYIGKGSEIDTARLEEIAEALNTRSQPRVTQQVTQQVTDKVTQQVTDRVTQQVTDRVTQQVTDKVCDGDRLTALELQVRTLQETLEALMEALPKLSEGLCNRLELPNPNREVTDNELHNTICNLEAEELPGKLGEGLCNRLKLPSPNTEVTDNELQTAIGNLRVENEFLKTDYAKLLESSTRVTSKLREEVQQLRSQVQAERTKWEELREELDDRPEIQKSVPAVADFPEPSDLLNQLRARRKKSKTDLADIEAVLEILSHPEE